MRTRCTLGLSPPVLAVVALLASLVGCGDAGNTTSTNTTNTTNGTAGATPDAGGGDGESGIVGNPDWGKKLADQRRCFQICHKAGNKVNAPLLEDSIAARVKMLADYPAYVAKLKTSDARRYEASAATIDAIAAATDADERLELWLAAYLENTTFDDAGNTMLQIKPALTDEEVTHMVTYLTSLQ